MEGAGAIKQISKLEIEWKIPNFDVSKKTGEPYFSPLFTFRDKFWSLWIYPNGLSRKKSVGFISLHLVNKSKLLSEKIEVALGLKVFNEKGSGKMVYAKFIPERIYAVDDYLSRSELLERKSEFLPFNTLTVLCSVDNSAENATTETLVDDLSGMFYSEEHSDVTIKVKNEEFHLHRCILAGRNPYFNSKFKTEMKEKATGIVTINDCDPDLYYDFMHFLYTGKVCVSSKTVCDLYKVADKYQADQLKEKCLCFMKKMMSVESFCSFTVLALQHEEKELLQHATDLFCRNTREIIQSDDWQTFIRKYPTEANELHIKALDYYAK